MQRFWSFRADRVWIPGFGKFGAEDQSDLDGFAMFRMQGFRMLGVVRLGLLAWLKTAQIVGTASTPGGLGLPYSQLRDALSIVD